MFLRFFNFLDGRYEFDYEQYVEVYNRFTDYILALQRNIGL